MSKIFISYRRNDSADIAGRIYDRLEAKFGAHQLYIDIDAIPIGVDFRQHIESYISDCDVFLAIIGESWLTRFKISNTSVAAEVERSDDFVLLEIQAALKWNVKIIPILTGNAKMPEAAELPISIADFAYLNAAEVRSGTNFRSQIERLIVGIQNYIETEPKNNDQLSTTPSLIKQLAISDNLKNLSAENSLLASSAKKHRPAKLVDPAVPASQPLFASKNATRKRTFLLYVGGLLLLLAIVSILWTQRSGIDLPQMQPQFSDTFEIGQGALFAEYGKSWQLTKNRKDGTMLCGHNLSQEAYSYLVGNQIFSGNISATFDVMFKNFAANQEGMFTFNLSGTNNTYYGLFMVNGVVELTKVQRGKADEKSIVSSGRPVFGLNEWQTFRLVRRDHTIALYQGNAKDPLLSRTEPVLLPNGVLAFAVGEYNVSSDPNLTMCIDNLRVTEL